MTINGRIAVLLLSLLGMHNVQANQQEALEVLRQRISALQQDMEKTSESKSETTDALRESERAISNTNRRLYQITQQQHDAKRSLEQLQKKTRQVSDDMQAHQLLLAKLLHQQYLGGKQEYFKLLLNNHNPNQTARELQYYEYIAKSRAAWLKDMRGNLARLNSITGQARQKNEELAQLQDEQTRQKQTLLQEKNTHKQVLNKISLQLKRQHREIDKLQRDEQHLAKLLEKLSRIVAQPRPAPTGKDSSIQPERNFTPPFVTLKGKLPLPVKGRITNQFGSKRPDSPVIWKGLFLLAQSSQPVYAVAPGRVIFADWLRGFGNLLIIDHGLGYMSLYGNNEALYKQVGEELLGGDTVAAVGNSGGNENYGLYFELRHEGIPLDPAKWVKRNLLKIR